MGNNRQVSELVQEAQSGDRAAFQAIYDLFAPRIYNFLIRMTGSKEEAEDITQQTFLIAIRRLPGLRDADQIESWIYRIARNEAYQKFRRKKAIQLDGEYAGETDGSGLIEQRLHANPEELLLSHELRQVLQKVLLRLSPKLREVFVLAIVQGMSYKDVSTITGRSLLAVKTDIYRARLNAKEELRKYLDPSVKVKADTR
jgi:RNA polymerase sigma-70 factor (ECF subfamily)